ncbi:MAG TPA: SDR family oxidoreductase [Candidatus Kapabacteria bacterium]|nr:SDR family oxidoreductase [Candidatus Kapabacteria bacterium]
MSTLFLTGVTGALGLAIREKYLAEGWNVAGFAHKDDGFTQEHYRFWPVDASDETSVEQSFSNAAKALGAPRALIATIGGVRPWKTVAETSIQDFRALFELNLASFFLSAKYALRSMQGEGTIISIGAEPALEPSAKKGGYVAAKSGVIALTRVIAEEGKATGITANCIVPTVIHTKANEEWGKPDDFSKWTKPEDIAAMCFFLTSEVGKAVNGAVIRMPNRL